MGCFGDSFVCHVNPFFLSNKVKLYRSLWIIWATVKRRGVENAEWRVRSSAAVWLPDGVITARGLPKVGLELCLSHSGHKDEFIHSVWTTDLITQGLYMQQSTGLMYCHAQPTRLHCSDWARWPWIYDLHLIHPWLSHAIYVDNMTSIMNIKEMTSYSCS